jgi:hypothetical protein
MYIICITTRVEIFENGKESINCGQPNFVLIENKIVHNCLKKRYVIYNCHLFEKAKTRHIDCWKEIPGFITITLSRVTSFKATIGGRIKGGQVQCCLCNPAVDHVSGPG